ncbi:hypothetical protein JE034_03600 [Achromobacter xylosoxidans]|uniref:hypothetical protein n=1 Tax=Alcaligenes xylosoxydans xylosoxydans TaxID=85698 RepID=UPI001902CE16|nr:hypothetical protein [Achromobacter xylosoxidans]MBK1977936.1 hypothetical protein [Achromobacter xylosoxidans]
MARPVNGSQPSLGGVGLESSSGVRGSDLVGADQDTAMLSVQGERGRLLDKQIETQIRELRALNRRLELLNIVQAGLKAVQAQFNASAKYDKEWDDASGGWSFRLADRINRAAAEAGINLGFAADSNTWRLFGHMGDMKDFARAYLPSGQADLLAQWRDKGDLRGQLLAAQLVDRMAGRDGFMAPDYPGQTLNRCPGGIRYDSEYGELRKAVTRVQGAIDEASNLQQDQMLRLQALMNRRNESADMLTNYIRKMQDSRMAISEKIRGT